MMMKPRRGCRLPQHCCCRPIWVGRWLCTKVKLGRQGPPPSLSCCTRTPHTTRGRQTRWQTWTTPPPHQHIPLASAPHLAAVPGESVAVGEVGQAVEHARACRASSRGRTHGDRVGLAQAADAAGAAIGGVGVQVHLHQRRQEGRGSASQALARNAAANVPLRLMPQLLSQASLPTAGQALGFMRLRNVVCDHVKGQSQNKRCCVCVSAHAGQPHRSWHPQHTGQCWESFKPSLAAVVQS
jgi:hypothetical protein